MQENSSADDQTDNEADEHNNDGLLWLVEWMIGGFIGLCVVCFLLAMLSPQQGIPKLTRTPCLNNLRQISLAMQNYATARMRFPPAYIADETGKPIHSWRVLLLPYLDQEELYKKYSFDEPWDGPNNFKLHDEILSVYQCPKASRGGHGRNSNYMLITGKGTAFDGPSKISAKDVDDGLSNTLMVVEVANSDTHWMDPVDLPIEEALARLTDPAQAQQCCNHPNQVNISLMDGSTHSLEVPLSTENLKALITVDGGEFVDISDL